MIRYLDVCSGYSAFTQANEGLGFECVGYAEIEAFPAALLGAHYGATRARYMPDPDAPELSLADKELRTAMRKSMASLPDSQFGDAIPNFGDFTQIREDDIDGPVHLLTGGTPCQAFSVAGKRLGLDDPRGNLTLEFLALAQRVRAEWLLWENVPGFLSHDEGRTMGTFLRLLGQCGYGFAYRVLDAQYIRVDGLPWAVPQRRRRLFVVAHLGDAAGPAAVLFDRESLRGDPAPRRETREDIAGTISASASRGRGAGTDVAGIIGEVAPTIPSRTNAGGGTGMGISEGTSFNLTTGRPHAVAHAIQAGALRENPASGPDGVGVQDDIAYTLEARAEVQAVAFAQNTRDELRMVGGNGGIAGALAAQPGMKQQSYIAFPEFMGATAHASTENVSPALGAINPTAVASAWAVRRLTPLECERLMGVRDGLTAITYRGKPASDGPRYKALGNSQARNQMRWLAHGLADVIRVQG